MRPPGSAQAVHVPLASRLRALVQTIGKTAAPAGSSTGLGLGRVAAARPSCGHPTHEIPTTRRSGASRGGEGEGRRLQRAPVRPFGWWMLHYPLGAGRGQHPTTSPQQLKAHEGAPVLGRP